MRLLAVGNMYPPHHLGGYELVWQSAMAHVRAHGHEVRVLTTDFHRHTGQPDEPGTYRELRWYWRDHAWPRLSWRERAALERHNAEVLERHLEQLRPEVVSWWSMGGMSLSLIERVRRAGLPAVAFVHDDWLIYGPTVDLWTGPWRHRPRLAALAERATRLVASVELDTAARYVFVSETVRAHAKGGGYRMDQSAIAHSGIDATYLDPRPPRPWRWRLLYVGRIDERKGIHDAVRALAALPADATLTLAGTGEERAIVGLRAEAARLGVSDRIHELGMRTRAELPAVYEACDVVLFPVRWEEPWGLVPLEAMGLGRPVIATGRGGSGEYLRDGENALLVGVRSPDQIAAAVRRLAGDAELRARLITGGQRTARTHTAAAFEEAVLAALIQAT